MADLNARKLHLETVINALETVLEGKATKDTQSYSIGDRSISKMSPDELLTWRNKYYQELRNVENQIRVSEGLDITGRKIQTRFA